MPSNSIHSYVEFMNKNLFDYIDIPKQNIHIPDGTISADQVDKFCLAYEKTIEDYGGIDTTIGDWPYWSYWIQ